MSRSLFVTPWHDTVIQCVLEIDMALSSKFGLGSHRNHLENARDRLHVLVHDWPHDFDRDDPDPVYENLVDSLSWINAGLKAHPVRRGDIVHAQEILRELRDQAISH